MEEMEVEWAAKLLCVAGKHRLARLPLGMKSPFFLEVVDLESERLVVLLMIQYKPSETICRIKVNDWLYES